jgi:DNA-binding IclR family transcriptional regulator
VQREDILREMARIRVSGYATDNEEMEEGVRCVAALVFDHSRRASAAVSVSGAATRMPPERIHQLGQSVKRCALMISRELGYPVHEQNTKTTVKEVDHA